MKKYIVMLAMLGLAAVSGLTYSIHKILNQKDAVKIDYEVLEGNPAAAEGITFHVRNQWNGKLHWDSQVVLGDDGEIESIVTEFENRFKEPTEENARNYSISREKVNLYLNYVGIGGGNTWISARGCETAVCTNLLDTCAAETKPGETNTQVVQLNHYQPYYSIDLFLNLNEGSYYTVGSEWEVWDNFLKIEIPDSHQLEVTVQKNEKGEIIMQQCNVIYGLEAFEISSVQTANSVYFTFYGVDTEGQPYDLDIECGNGVFCIPLEPVSEKEKSKYFSSETIIYYNKVQNVLPLSETGCYSLELVADEEEQMLYLLAREHEQAVLRIFDMKTMEERQKLKLTEHASYGIEHQIDIRKDGIVVFLSDSSFCYLEENNGALEKKVVARLGEGPRPSDGKYCYDIIYREDKAILLIAEYENGSTEAYIYVLGEKGVEYKAHFMPSFAYETYHGGTNWIHLRKEDPLEITIE